MTEHIDNKRRFTRIPFVSEVVLKQANHQWRATAVDISFKGLLLNITKSEDINTSGTTKEGSPFEATIHFENGTELHAGLELAHCNDHLYGFRFTEMDMDGMTHLRNIVMLNLGNDSACERELINLFSYHQ